MSFFFFINSQLHLVVFVLNRFLDAVRDEMSWGKHYTSSCLPAQLIYPEIARKGRINTKVLDMNPTKAKNSADIVASKIWPRATDV